MSLNKNSTSMNVGGSEQLEASIAPSNATNQNLTWESDTPSVAEVSANGLVTAVSSGEATITVTTADGGKTAVCEVTVNVAVVFQSAVETGGTSDESDSTGLTLTFSADPGPLTADNITVTGAAKGALSGSGATRSLAISDITVANGESVSVAITSPPGYAISGSPQAAVVYRSFYYIGKTHEGGVIAYIFQSGDPGYVAGQTHGLIAASSDQSSSIVWALSANASTSVPDGTGTALGTGSSNTDKIIAQNGEGSYAAKCARDYTGGGYEDWYLPSEDELNKLYGNKSLIGGLPGAQYYSSSEVNASAVRVLYADGWWSSLPKNALRSVRAVRNF